MKLKWWNRLWGSAVAEAPTPKEAIRRVGLTLPEWNEEAPDGGMRVWRDADRNVLSLAAVDVPDVFEGAEIRQWCRDFAQGCHAGLIEVKNVAGPMGPAVSLIYKRLQMPAYVFTGMLFSSVQGETFVWTVVAGERGITGVREAAVTLELMQTGKLTVADYQQSWAKDPYDPSYRGVDGNVLRFMSDDECYDERFSDHPLSKVRRVLTLLPSHVDFDSREPQAKT